MPQVVQTLTGSGTWTNPIASVITTLDYVSATGPGAPGGAAGGGGGASATNLNSTVAGSATYVIGNGSADADASAWDVEGDNSPIAVGGSGTNGGTAAGSAGSVKFSGGNAGTTGGGGGAGPAGNGVNGSVAVGGAGGANTGFNAATHGGTGGNATLVGAAPGGGGGSLANGGAGRIVLAYTLTAPVITSVGVVSGGGSGASANLSAIENSTGAATLNADTVQDTGGWSIVGGADQAFFVLTDLGDAGLGSTATAELTFATPPNYEIPADANGDNIYVVIVRASNPATHTDQTLNITLTNDPSDDPTTSPKQNKSNLRMGSHL